MNDDFNTSDAIAVLFDLANEVNKTGSSRETALMRALGGVLGLLQQNSQQYFQDAGLAGDPAFTPERIEQLIQQRLVARANRNYSEADSIRRELLEAGILLEDGPQGTTWRRETSSSIL